MLWAAATMCFFGFFHSGELTVPSMSSFDSTRHLAWGDVSIDNRESPKIMEVYLKRSKTDQSVVEWRYLLAAQMAPYAH